MDSLDLLLMGVLLVFFLICVLWWLFAFKAAMFCDVDYLSEHSIISRDVVGWTKFYLRQDNNTFDLINDECCHGSVLSKSSWIKLNTMRR